MKDRKEGGKFIMLVINRVLIIDYSLLIILGKKVLTRPQRYLERKIDRATLNQFVHKQQ
jgi:hypothetical protein